MAQPPNARSLNFKERMAGHVVIDDLDDLVVPNTDGTGWTRVALDLRMHIEDVDAFWHGTHVGTMKGFVDCDALGGRLPVRDGRFQLMVLAPGGNERHQHMNYLIEFEDGMGRPLTLDGYKEVATGDFSAWEDTTTMLTRIHHGWITDFTKWQPDAAGAGVLRIRFVDFLRQTLTFRPDRSAGLLGGLRVMFTFTWDFTRSLWRVYGFGHRRKNASPE